MGSFLKQAGAAVAMSLESMPSRIWLSIATVGSIALVVVVLTGVLALREGFRETLANTGSENVAIVLREGSNAEASSSIDRDQVRLIEEAPGVARDAQGRPIASGEIYLDVLYPKPGSELKTNLALRGVGPFAREVRPGVAIVEGRNFTPGTNEIVVGRRIAEEYEGFDVGGTVRFGVQNWRVVGIFDAPGVFASEIWADVGTVQSLFNRGPVVQSVRLLLERPSALADVTAYADNEPRLTVDVATEKAFFAEQNTGTVDLIVTVGYPIALFLALGALAGAVNAMNSSVDSRVREMATLRAIGFGGASAFVGVLSEACLLALIGGAVAVGGGLLVFTLFDLSTSLSPGGFNQFEVVFPFELSPAIAGLGLGLALLIGLVGGLAPAFRAARTPILRLGGD